MKSRGWNGRSIALSPGHIAGWERWGRFMSRWIVCAATLVSLWGAVFVSVAAKLCFVFWRRLASCWVWLVSQGCPWMRPDLFRATQLSLLNIREGRKRFGVVRAAGLLLADVLTMHAAAADTGNRNQIVNAAAEPVEHVHIGNAGDRGRDD